MGFKKEQKFTGVVRARVHGNIKISLPSNCNLSEILRAAIHPELFNILTEYKISITETMKETQNALFEQLAGHLHHHKSPPKKVTITLTLDTLSAPDPPA